MRAKVHHDYFDEYARRRVNHRVLLRAVGLFGLAAVCALVPEVGPNRFVLAPILLAMTVVPVAISTLLPPHLVMKAQPSFDVFATVALIWLAPDVWTAGLVIIVGSPAASAVFLGRRGYVLLEALGLTGLAIGGVIVGAEGLLVPIAAAAVLVPLVGSYVDVFLANDHGAAARLADIAASADVILWEADPQTGRLLSVSGRTDDILGYSRGEVPPDMAQLVHPDDLESLSRAPRDDAGWTEGRCRLRRANGSWAAFQLSFRIIGKGSAALARGVAVDVTELVTLAETDELTGLANRAVLNRVLEEHLDEGDETVLMMMDLDRFKEVNDTLGHHSGDVFLREIACRLAGETDDRSLVARIGGDEFAFAVWGPGAVERSVDLARRAAAACERPVTLDGLEFAGSSSIGIAAAPEHAALANELMRLADLAMYSAKRAGQAYRVYSRDHRATTIDRLSLSADIAGALERDELRLWFQPKIDLATSELVGAEGLLRWHHPQRGVLEPRDFLDVVEISRHFTALTVELVEQAARMLARTEASGIHASVNVSMKNLSDRAFGQQVIDRLLTNGVDPSRLILEMTEREITTDRADVVAALAELRQAGVGLSIDDFGTGHSSLLRLHELPVTEVKIDRRFVSELRPTGESAIIVRGIVELGKRLGHCIVAEGVEDLAQLGLLRELGCDLGQGYLWSKAVEVDEFVATAMSNLTPVLDAADVTG